MWFANLRAVTGGEKAWYIAASGNGSFPERQVTDFLNAITTQKWLILMKLDDLRVQIQRNLLLDVKSIKQQPAKGATWSDL